MTTPNMNYYNPTDPNNQACQQASINTAGHLHLSTFPTAGSSYLNTLNISFTVPNDAIEFMKWLRYEGYDNYREYMESTESNSPVELLMCHSTIEYVRDPVMVRSLDSFPEELTESVGIRGVKITIHTCVKDIE